MHPLMGKHRIEYMNVDELVDADRNAKEHAEALIGASLTEFGYIESIVMDDRTGQIVSGHGRRDGVIAARDAGEPAPDGVQVKAGKWLVPVERGWSSRDDDHATAAGIALNHIGERGGWDPDRLFADLDSLPAGGSLLAATGFDDEYMQSLRASIALRDGPKDPEPEVPVSGPPKNPKTKRGDIWELGEHRLICGDCRDADVVARLVDGRQINVAFTSPPYAEQREYDESSGFKPIPPDEYVEWFAPVAGNVATHLAPDGSWFVNIKPPGLDLDTHLYVFDLVTAHVRQWGWHFATEFCWERTGVPKHVTRRFKNQFEPVYQFALGDWKIRPDNVQHASMNAIVPLGDGAAEQLREAGSNADWSQVQGGGDMFPKVGKRAKKTALDPTGRNVTGRQGAGGSTMPGRETKDRTDHSFVRMSKSDGTTAPAPRRDRKDVNSGSMAGFQGVPGGPNVGKRARKAQRTGADARKPRDEVQGTNWAPGEAQAAGWAYPGNRLPTFSGTHTATGHSAAFPVGLPAWFVRAYSDPGDVIYDPFLGSGSTLLAAASEGRVGLGVELSPGYCDVICRRFQEVTGTVPRRVGAARPTSFA